MFVHKMHLILRSSCYLPILQLGHSLGHDIEVVEGELALLGVLLESQESVGRHLVFRKRIARRESVK